MLRAAGGGTSVAGSDTQVQFNDGGSLGGDAALTWDKTNNVLTIAQGTITTSNPQVVTATWNDAAVTFTGWKMNVTSTASAAASLLADLQIGGSTVFKVTKAGGAFPLATGFTYTGQDNLKIGTGGSLYSSSESVLGFVVSAAGGDFYFNNGTGTTGVTLKVNSPGGDYGIAFINGAGFSNTVSGVLELNSGTVGAFRDLKYRSSITTGVNATSAAAPTIASAATIAPTTAIAFVSGTTNVVTITPPAPISAGGGQITLIPTGAWATTTAGNIALASTAVVSKALTLTYDVTTTKWYPSY